MLLKKIVKSTKVGDILCVVKKPGHFFGGRIYIYDYYILWVNHCGGEHVLSSSHTFNNINEL